MIFLFTNNVSTTLADAVSVSATSVTLASAANLPSSIPAGSVIALTLSRMPSRGAFEVVYITGISGATLTVERAQEGSVAQEWEAGDMAFCSVSAGSLSNMLQKSQGYLTGIPAGSITQASFAPGLQPIAIVTTLPSAAGYTGPTTVFNQADGKLYRYVNGAWTAAVPTTDLTGTITASQIAAGAVDATAFADSIQPVSVASSLPSASGYTGPSVVYNTGDGQLYRYANGAFTAAVPTVNLTGTIPLDGSVITGAGTLAGLNAVDFGTAEVLNKTADNLFYGAETSGVTVQSLQPAEAGADITSTHTALNTTNVGAVSATDMAGWASESDNTYIDGAHIYTGSITAGQIAAGAIGADQIAANTITAGQLAANTITSGQIAAGAIGTQELAAGAVTAAQIATNTITANQIKAGTITAAEMGVTELSAISADLGTATAGTFATTASATGRTELSSVGDFPLWVGTGAKTAANAAMYVDTDGQVTVNQLNVIDTLNIQPNSVGSSYWINQVQSPYAMEANAWNFVGAMSFIVESLDPGNVSLLIDTLTLVSNITTLNTSQCKILLDNVDVTQNCWVYVEPTNWDGVSASSTRLSFTGVIMVSPNATHTIAFEINWPSVAATIQAVSYLRGWLTRR